MSEVLEKTKEKIRKKLGKYGELTDFEGAKKVILEDSATASGKFEEAPRFERARANVVLSKLRENAVDATLAELEVNAIERSKEGVAAFHKYMAEENPKLVERLFGEIDRGIGNLKLVEEIIPKSAELEKNIGPITAPIETMPRSIDIKNIIVDKRHLITKEVAGFIYKMHNAEGKSPSEIFELLTGSGAVIGYQTVKRYAVNTLDEARRTAAKGWQGRAKKRETPAYAVEPKDIVINRDHLVSPELADAIYRMHHVNGKTPKEIYDLINGEGGRISYHTAWRYSTKTFDEVQKITKENMKRKKEKLKSAIVTPEDQRVYLGKHHYVSKGFIGNVTGKEEGRVPKSALRRELHAREGGTVDVGAGIKELAAYLDENFGYATRWNSNGVRYKKREAAARLPSAMEALAGVETVQIPTVQETLAKLPPIPGVEFLDLPYRISKEFDKRVTDEVDVLGDIPISNDALFAEAAKYNPKFTFQFLKQLKEAYKKDLEGRDKKYNVDIKSDRMDVKKT